MDKSLSLGMPMSPQEIFNRYKRQSLGMPWASPSSSTKYQVVFLDAIFLLLHILCVILGASQFLFSVLFCFVLLSILYSWIPAIFVLERTHSVLIAKNTLVFILIVLRVFYFSSTAFSSCFSFIFCSELVCFLWQGMIQLSDLY